MRANFVMLAVLAGLGVSGAGAAEAKNLSCITGISPSEQRLLRDCEPTPQVVQETVYVYEMPVPPPPPPEPARMKHGESGKEKGSFGRDKNGGGSHGGGGGGGSAAHGNESAGGSSAN